MNVGTKDKRSIDVYGRSEPALLEERRIAWHTDGKALRALYGTTWKGHRILREQYFDWQFLQNPRGEAIGYYARPTKKPAMCAGVYLVLPTATLVGDQRLAFSTSLYTMTHPDYYGKGIFGRLAKKTYGECLRSAILGTIGVPNNSSLPGFTKALGFKAIGQFHVVARIAQFPIPVDDEVQIKEVHSQQDLAGLVFELDVRKANSGVVLNERNEAFVAWRFLRCPGVNYRVPVAIDQTGCVKGMLVLRAARKRRVPVAVLVDFIIDHTSSAAENVGRSLLNRAWRFAWQHLSPLTMALVNPFSYEAAFLVRSGFKQLPKALLPHDSNFILKLHSDLPESIAGKLHDFNNWYFSFADYDIF